MKLKISGNTPEQLNTLVTRVMNLACVVARYGTLPDDSDVAMPERGQVWQCSGWKYDLFPANNDAWAFVRGYGDDNIVVEFSFRHDPPGNPLSEALTRLIAARWPDVCEIVE